MLSTMQEAATAHQGVTGEPTPRAAKGLLVAAAFLGAASWITTGHLPSALETVGIFGLPIGLVWYAARSQGGRAWLQLGLCPRSMAAGNQLQWSWLALGLAVVVGGICILETIQPLYFTQDDSLANGVVGMVVGGRSLESGQFPVWNPCQYMGSPMASMAYWSLTYPPTYLSYAVATNLLGNEWWTMEVYQLGHLVLSYFALFWAARSVGLSSMTSAMAAVTVALSGTSLIVGRSWYATIPLNVWLPLLVVGISRLRQGPVSWRWVAANGLVMGILFHVGYPQTWVYAMLCFLGCTLLSWSLGEIGTRRVAYSIAAQLVGVAIASPLLLTLLLETRGNLIETYGHGVSWAGLVAMLLPYPLFRAAHPEKWGSTDLPMMGQMYYGGSLLSGLAIGGMASLVAARQQRTTLKANYWLIVAAFWFVVMLGHKAVLWVAMSLLPGFSNFSCPFKAQQFFTLFAALGAGLILDRWLSRDRVRGSLRATVMLSVMGLMLYHSFVARPSFYSYGYEPYPELPSEFERLRESPQRVLVVAPERSIDPTFPLSLQLNSATAYGIRSAGGYDPLVVFSPQMFRVVTTLDDRDDGWETYGVKWIVVHRTAGSTTFSENETFARKETVAPARLAAVMERLRRKRATVYYESPVVTIYELPATNPMAFAASAADQPLPIWTDNSGIRVDTSGTKSERITINYVLRPFMRATADGQPIPLAADDFDRLVARLPTGTAELIVRYRPPWHWGLAVGLTLCIAAIAIIVGLAWIKPADGHEMLA